MENGGSTLTTDQSVVLTWFRRQQVAWLF